MQQTLECIADLMGRSIGEERVFPPTLLFEEGWMLRLVLQWFSKNKTVDHPLAFDETSKWYSEATLTSAFLPRYVTFQLAEVAVSRDLFGKILALIDGLRPRPVPV